LKLTVANDSKDMVMAFESMGFPGCNLAFVDDQGHECPLTDLGQWKFKMGAPGSGSFAKIAAGTSHQWSFPITKYFASSSNSWCLTGSVVILSPDLDAKKACRLSFPKTKVSF